MLALTVVAWLLSGLVIAGWVYWIIAWLRVRIAARPEFSIRAGLDLPEQGGSQAIHVRPLPVSDPEKFVEDLAPHSVV